MTPWIIVNFHTPWYNTYTGKHNEMEAIGMKKAMEDLFYKYHVNAAFSGHVHAYERFLPMYKNVTTVNATIYMTVGTGGQSYGKTVFNYISSRSYVLMSPVYLSVQTATSSWVRVLQGAKNRTTLSTRETVQCTVMERSLLTAPQ